MVKKSVLAAAWLLLSACGGALASDRPKLIVQITVDGLRGDLLSRYHDSFGPGGFRRLTEGGVWYTDAHHLHANTETIVGHTTLATGAHPSEHGMIGNAWFDRAEGRLGYNIEDPDHPMLPVPGFDGDGAQIDPTQAAAKTAGRSPVNILSSTFADELSKSNAGRSKVFAVSGKDRSAVSMAGHRGKAFWMSTATGAYETSSRYYDAYPDWAVAWNAARPADRMANEMWFPECHEAPYLMDNTKRDFATDLGGFGKTFPHLYGSTEDDLYYTQVFVSPYGDRLTADFAKALVEAEDLGADDWPDYLSVSFSGVDAINHFFGPSSLQNEELVRCLDITLSDLFAFLDKVVGQDNVLYVLSADHGMPEAPEQAAAAGLSTVRMSTEALVAQLNPLLREEFGIEETVRHFFRPYIYLDHDAIASAGADKRAIERRIVDVLMNEPGIAMAMPAVPLAEQEGDFLQAPIRRNYNPQRSGDIYVVQSPYSFLFEQGAIAVMHGSPWRYDTHVPVLFAGEGIDARKVPRRVSTTDVAVTLSLLLGTSLPSAASGAALSEVLQ